jgi:peptidoglycan-associated lipoprotein
MRKLAILAMSLLVVAGCSSTSEETLSGSGTTTTGDAAVGSSDLGSALGSGVASGELGAVTPGSAADFEVNVGDRVFFAFDSSVIDEAGRETLQRQAAWLQQFPEVRATIEGHTDSIGTREYNLALGERRATAARNYLEALGIAPNRLQTTSYGEERPADPGDNDAAHALNRRAVTVVTLTN